MFAGIGMGIVATSFLTPVFDSWGSVKSIWAFLAVLTFVLAAIAASICIKFKAEKSNVAAHSFKLDNGKRKIFRLALIGYALFAIGSTTNLLFLSDYAHRDLGASSELSSYLFAILGVGCVVGSITAGWLKSKIGNCLAVIFTSIVGIFSLAVIVFIPSVIAVAISAFLTGFYLIALVVLMSLFIGNLVGMQNHAKYWSYMTLIFAGSQFIAGYVFSYLLNFKFSYHHMFEICLGVLILSLISYLFVNGKESGLLSFD